mgnify:CR=1 FL=1
MLLFADPIVQVIDGDEHHVGAIGLCSRYEAADKQETGEKEMAGHGWSFLEGDLDVKIIFSLGDLEI